MSTEWNYVDGTRRCKRLIMSSLDPRLNRGNRKPPKNEDQSSKLMKVPRFTPTEPEKSLIDQVNDLLNEASLTNTESVKISCLKKVQDLLFNKDPALIDNYTDEIIAFQSDDSFQVKCFVIRYIEQACLQDPTLMPKLYSNYLLTLENESSTVAKEVILSTTKLHQHCMKEMITNTDDAHATLWKLMNKLQALILAFLDSEKDGLRTQTVKYLQTVILTTSMKPHNLTTDDNDEKINISLEDIPRSHPFISKDDLQTDGDRYLTRFLDFVISPLISSSNLLVAMNTMSEFANDRPQFMAAIVQAFESLHANLPPTLAKNQVGNVRKLMKMYLLKLLRQNEAHEYHPQITALLYALGTNANEIARNMPKEVIKDKKTISKRKGEQDEYGNKKAKLDDDEDVLSTSPSSSDANKVAAFKSTTYNAAVNITAQELVPLLSPENVANLVLLSMVMLPDKIPDAFQASYTPIESAGTKEQIQHLARLLSTQMTAVGIGSGIKKATEMQAEEEGRRQLEKQKKEKAERYAESKFVSIQTVIGGVTSKDAKKSDDKKTDKKQNVMEMSQPLIPVKSAQRRMKGFNLPSITKPLKLELMDEIIQSNVLRALRSEENCIRIGMHATWEKLATKLVARFGGVLHKALADYILTDIRNRSNLAFQWLYEEFNICMENSRGNNDREAQENYSAAMDVILRGILDKHDAKEGIFAKMLMQAPLLTDGSIKILQEYCEDERHSSAGLTLTKNLMSQRPSEQFQFLAVLFKLAASPKEKVRSEAVEFLVEMYKSGSLVDQIGHFAIVNLSHLSNEAPPPIMFKSATLTSVPTETIKWTDELIRQCMSLCLSLLPSNHQLIKNLAEVYVKANSAIKRNVLRSLDNPINGMGMDSPALLNLVEECPEGAETLVTRMLHILTDKEHPTPQLTEKVRDLHRKRVPDVRFLIPVLTGLTKAEVLEALPKLILHSPTVVQGVISRLLRSRRQLDSDTLTAGPVTPQELLIHLHNVELKNDDFKYNIKAIQMCFSEKSIYTPEVIVGVINKLLEQSEFPPLMMRTLLQALIAYPRISGYVMSVLNRLVAKEAWNSPKTWQGFTKCCQRLKPQSFQILLQLARPQLVSVLDIAPEMREEIRTYVAKFTNNDRERLGGEMLAELNKTPEEVEKEKLAAAKKVKDDVKRAKSKVRKEEWKKKKKESQRQKKEHQNALELATKAALEVSKELLEGKKRKHTKDDNSDHDGGKKRKKTATESTRNSTSDRAATPTQDELADEEK